MDAGASHGFVESLAKSFDTPPPASKNIPADDQPNAVSDPSVSPPSSTPSHGTQGPISATAQVPVGDTPSSAAENNAPTIEAPKRGEPPARSAPKFIPMTLSGDERNTLAEFARFAGTSPRRAKRYLNQYLLLKTSLQSSITRGDNRQVAERAIVALLAVVTARGPADVLFRILVDSNTRPDDLDGLLVSLNNLSNSQPAAKAGATDDSLTTTSHQVIAKLIELNRRDSLDQGHATLTALAHYAPTVRRYSF
jgi:hypothetical protein